MLGFDVFYKGFGSVNTRRVGKVRYKAAFFDFFFKNNTFRWYRVGFDKAVL